MGGAGPAWLLRLQGQNASRPSIASQALLLTPWEPKAAALEHLRRCLRQVLLRTKEKASLLPLHTLSGFVPWSLLEEEDEVAHILLLRCSTENDRSVLRQHLSTGRRSSEAPGLLGVMGPGHLCAGAPCWPICSSLSSLNSGHAQQCTCRGLANWGVVDSEPESRPPAPRVWHGSG